MPRLAVLGSALHYLDEGKGDPIVFLHGNPTSSYLWRHVIPVLADQGRCLAPDLIGMGESDKPELEYTFLEHAQYLDGWFDALELSNITLVVHDWGSALGIYWARRHPGRVRALAMMEPIVEAIGWDDFIPPMVELFQGFRTPGVGEQMILEANMFVEKVLPAAILRRLSADEMNVYRAPYLEPRFRKPTLAWPRQLPIAGEPPEIIEIIEESATWLAQSAVPKLLLTFEPGALLDAAAVERVSAKMANLELRKIGPGLHYVQEDHPREIGEAVRDWRRRVLASAGDGHGHHDQR
jgi:haloalkane dehalogenase